MEAPDEVRWFDKVGSCTECSKSAIGVLRGPQNQSYGPYCETHGMRRLANAKKEREAFHLAEGKPDHTANRSG